MQEVLILHGWFGNPESNWIPAVKKRLEAEGMKVVVPQLKDAMKPTLDDWTCSVTDVYEINKNTSIVGFSLGAVLGLNLIMRLDFSIDTFISVSGWDHWDLTPQHETFFKESIDHKKIIDNTRRRFVVHSSNDPYKTSFISKKYAERLQAEYIELPNAGHITAESGFTDLPIIVDILTKSQ